SAFDGSEGKHVLSTVAAVSAPGLIARIISLLQDKLLPVKGGVLKTNPSATLHFQGANGLHAVLHNVLAAGGEFTTPALEMPLLELKAESVGH
ncbi:hypothetical protein QML15_26990, partial [Klebsiella pneumoniae]